MHTRRMKLTLLLGGVAGYVSLPAKAASGVEEYLSPDCSCCGTRIKHLTATASVRSLCL